MIALPGRALLDRRHERAAPTPFRVAVRGAVCGYAGMAAMGAVVKALQAVQGGGQEQPSRWDEAQPAAKFAHRFIEGVALRHVSLERAGLLNNAMHLLYAPWLGVWYAAVHESARPRPLVHGLVFGSNVWMLRLALNTVLQLKKPFWEETPQRNATDASFHLVFGLAVAGAYRQIEGTLVDRV